MIIERIKFYADTPVSKNVYFCFGNVSILDIPQYFEKWWSMGWRIRSAWTETIETTTGEVKRNLRIKNLSNYESEFFISKSKKGTPDYTKVLESIHK
jgi:hypothetical protein